ncbi:MAG: SpaH/EbpB family LPXTG-anchored major pilin [Suipraeoptans sp.]
MKKNRLLRKISAMFAAAALTAGLVATSASASGLPDANRKGTITVHKLATIGESTTSHDGTELLPAEKEALGTPLEGAGFTLYYVKDESVLGGSNTPDEIVANHQDKIDIIGTEKTTSVDGIATWDDLEIGYYILKETTVPAGYTESASSIITLPFGFNPDKDNENATTEYNYDVHVYPKNVNKNNLTKVVTSDQNAYVVGDTVSWEINAKIDGKLYDNKTSKHGELKITDPLDERLTYTEKEAKLSLTGGSSPASLTIDTHYTEAITTAEKDAKTVVWKLTNEGLELAQERGSTGITVKISTKINGKAQGGATDSIKNTAKVYIKNISGDETNREIATGEKPEIKLGGVIIDKTNRYGEEKLANAKFKIATTEANAQDGVFIKDSVGKDIEVTTDGNGYAHFVDYSEVTPAVHSENKNTF